MLFFFAIPSFYTKYAKTVLPHAAARLPAGSVLFPYPGEETCGSSTSGDDLQYTPLQSA
jgi:hypothetical protein